MPEFIRRHLAITPHLLIADAATESLAPTDAATPLIDAMHEPSGTHTATQVTTASHAPSLEYQPPDKDAVAAPRRNGPPNTDKPNTSAFLNRPVRQPPYRCRQAESGAEYRGNGPVNVNNARPP